MSMIIFVTVAIAMVVPTVVATFLGASGHALPYQGFQIFEAPILWIVRLTIAFGSFLVKRGL